MKAFSPDDLRRTYIGKLLDVGADVSSVQQLAAEISAVLARVLKQEREEVLAEASKY